MPSSSPVATALMMREMRLSFEVSCSSMPTSGLAFSNSAMISVICLTDSGELSAVRNGTIFLSFAALLRAAGTSLVAGLAAATGGAVAAAGCAAAVAVGAGCAVGLAAAVGGAVAAAGFVSVVAAGAGGAVGAQARLPSKATTATQLANLLRGQDRPGRSNAVPSFSISPGR